ncbi:MAG: SBBP repeat-containing protein [Bacteroidetes bacterium]|nr:SBBP repeat-containing protein [Bacteroidota bacterium]
MKKYLFLFSLLLSCFYLQAQIPAFQWAKRAGSLGHDYPSSVTTDNDGNIYVTGNFQGTVDFDPNAGVYNLTAPGIPADIFVLKLNPNGNLVWARNMGGIGNDNGNFIAVDANQNVYITGEFQDIADFDPDSANTYNLTSANGSHDAFVCKLNAQGNLSWAIALGNTSDDVGYGIDLDKVGNVYTTGFFEGTVDFDQGPNSFPLTSGIFADAFILKMDSAGNFIWAKSVGGLALERGRSISLKEDGFVNVMGVFQNDGDFDPGPNIYTMTSFGVYDIFMLKLDTAGNYIWAKQIGGPDYEEAHEMVADSSGNTYITGTFQGTSDFDPGTATYNLSAYQNTEDFFITKLNSAGDLNWVKVIGGSGSDHGYGIALDRYGYVYSTGYSFDTTDFDPGPNVYNLFPISSCTYINILDSAGSFVWSGMTDGQYADIGYDIALDPGSNIFTVGTFMDTSDFDPGAGVFNMVANGNTHFDIFIQKMKSIGTGMNNVQTHDGISIFPNPSTGNLTIEMPSNHSEQYSIIDLLGQCVLKGNTTGKILNLNFEFLNDGIYILQISNKSYKIVKN